jgi:hypothetical protein
MARQFERCVLRQHPDSGLCRRITRAPIQRNHLREIPRPERQTMIDRGAKATVTRQAELLALSYSRSSVYYTPRALSDRDLLLMRRLDELHLQWPFYGSRELTRDFRRRATK